MVEILKLNFDQDIDAEDSEAERRSTCGLTQKQKHKSTMVKSLRERYMKKK